MATTLTTYPSTGASNAEPNWLHIFQGLMHDGVLRGSSLDLLGSYTTTPLLPFGDSTGLQVKVHPGRVFMKGQVGIRDSQLTLSIASNGTANPRLDSVIARLKRPSGGTVEVELDVLTGTADPSPQAPTLTQTATVWELELGRVSVSAGASTIASGDVTDKRIFAVAAGAPKAEARLDGAAGFVGYNIASLSNTATGRFLVTWQRAFADTSYRVHATAEFDGARFAVLHNTGKTTSQCEIRVYSDAGSLADPNYLHIAAWGEW